MDGIHRRRFLGLSLAGLLGGGLVSAGGCRSRQHAHVLEPDQEDMVGSHSGGASTWKPLVSESVDKLLARHAAGITPAGYEDSRGGRMRICFVAVENKSAEELGDFKEQIYQHIDTEIARSRVYRPVSRRFVETALRETRLRPDELFLPKNRRRFAATLEQLGQPFDYLLYATLTSGTTRSNNTDYQRDYLLTLEMVNVHTGDYDKESARVRKGYHRSPLGKLKHYDPL